MHYNSHFVAPWWACNPHVQTLLPTWYRRKQPLQVCRERLELADGDFVDLAWSDPRPAAATPLVVVFHGLEGSQDSPYIKGLFPALRRRGWQAVLMHFRGCSGVPNRLARGYHAGDTQDARQLIETIGLRFPGRPLLAVGYSLGGNMLVNYLARHGNDSRLEAAVVVSAPLQLKSCATRINQGFSRIYQKHLLARMKRNLITKLHQRPLATELGLSEQEVSGLVTMIEFDNRFTSIAHGFHDADDYYRQSSGLSKLAQLRTPTLVLHAADDPFMSRDVIPAPEQLSDTVYYELSRHGGHVGFVCGTPNAPRFWLDERIPAWFGQFV